MANRILEGLWDCPYCKTKGIGGLVKHCPACGHPQDNGTHFYLGTATKYLEDDLAKEYGQGADWVCPYCGSLNRVHFQYCANCSSAKEEAKEDYFSREEKPQDAEPETTEAPETPRTQPVKRGWKRFLPLIVIAVVIAGLVALLAPRSADGKVLEKRWERSVDVEAWRTVEEADWTVPDGAQVYDRRSEVHHFVPMLDHYETRTRQVPERVYDGEDEHVSYVDNGDGTFTEQVYTTPRYRTEYHTETYEEPVYRQDPIFQTKYYYRIERWVYDRTETCGAADGNACWPELNLPEDERESTRKQSYAMKVQGKKGKTYEIYPNFDLWSSYDAGDSVTLTTSGGKVTKLDGKPLQ